MAPKTPTRSAATVRSVDPARLVRPLCHEVGNLLAGIRLSAHLLREGMDDEEGGRTARGVEFLAAQAGGLLAQIRPLVASDPESRVRVTSASLLASVRRAVEGEMPEGVRLRVGAGRGLPDVRVDTEALHHLLVTLLLGAAETAPAARLRLEAAARGRRVVLSVSDDGPPITLREAAPEAARGRALAVRVAAAVVKASGGSVRLACGARRGNRVELHLPAAAASRRSRPRSPARAQARGEAGRREPVSVQEGASPVPRRGGGRRTTAGRSS
jgi:C4-dicarboxylate-specific signal transduction histidine kinase